MDGAEGGVRVAEGLDEDPDPDEVVDVLCDAFRDYPVMRFVLGPNRADYAADLRTLIGLFVMSRALRGEHLLGVMGDAGLEAAAIVSRPGAPSPPALAALREDVWSKLGADARGRVKRIEIKPETTTLRWTWAFALWTPRFGRFLGRWCESFRPRSARLGREPFVSDVLLAALAEGIEIETLAVPEARLLDIGTPETLARARAGSPAR